MRLLECTGIIKPKDPYPEFMPYWTRLIEIKLKSVGIFGVTSSQITKDSEKLVGRPLNWWSATSCLLGEIGGFNPSFYNYIVAYHPNMSLKTHGFSSLSQLYKFKKDIKPIYDRWVKTQ